MKFFNTIFALALSTLVFADKCCERCPTGKAKFYSIDKKFDRCGECCMDPKKFNIFKKFEKGLTRAPVENPCFELGYTDYENSETHGAFSLTMTLDKYKKPEISVEPEIEPEIEPEVQPVEPIEKTYY